MMKIYKTFFIATFCFLLLSCNDNKRTTTTDEETTKTERKTNSEDFTDLSIFNLPSHWTNQDGQEIELKDLQGKVTVMVMIYTTCKAACPRLIADMRNIESQIPEEDKSEVQYVFVSIDPETDTPERLKTFAKENKMEDEKWIFLRGEKEDTREFAAVLAVSYKRISPIDFSHSNIISVFNRDGELVHQREGLDVDYKATVKAIRELAQEN